MIATLRAATFKGPDISGKHKSAQNVEEDLSVSKIYTLHRTYK
jgi:hypothetical protein